MQDLDLDIDRDTHLSDVVAVQRHGLQNDISFQNRARWVSTSIGFQIWISSREGASLIVQGRSSFQRTSPLSFLISLLCENLQNQPGASVLPFFCGRRSAIADVSGPMVIAIAFLVQLLASHESPQAENTNERRLMEFLEAQYVMHMKQDSLEAYTTAISQLIHQLRRDSKAVFILVDGVDFFYSEWKDDMVEFILALEKVVRKARKRTRAGAVG